MIAGGTPLTDAVAFDQWNAARRLVERGAHVPLREAAALGMLDRVDELCAADPPPSADDLTQALWYACHGGQQETAERLLDLGAEPELGLDVGRADAPRCRRAAAEPMTSPAGWPSRALCPAAGRRHAAHL